MRSNSVKEHTNSNPIKGKKVMQFANLITTYQNDKNKSNAQKKTIQSNKSCNHYKPHISNDLAFDNKKNTNDKLKPYLKPQHQVKRHNRSKTQNFDPNLYQSSTLDLFKDIHIPSKLNSKKSQMKKEDSKKRLKTESLKRLNPVASFKASSKEFKKNLNTIGQKQTDQLFKQKKQKVTKKQNIKAYQQKQKAFEEAKNDLQALKGKFKKQKPNNQGENRNKNFSMKDQRKDKCKADNKNFSLLNLSQILHKSEYEDFLYPQQQQVRKKQLKSDRSSNSKHRSVRKKRLQALKNLSQLVEHFTQTVTEQIEQNYQNKNEIRKITDQSSKNEIGGRSFSFMNHKINQEMKHGKSNFSTGVDSIAFDEDIKQLIKLKLKTQKQINHKISKQIKQIAFQHLKDQNILINQSKRQIKKNSEMQEKSARTFRQNDSSQKQTQNQEKLILLDLLQKYNQMTQKIMPLIYQPHSSNPEQYVLKDVPQKSDNSQMDFIQKHNQKYIEKFNQIIVKNNQYQEIINALIRDGVNVQKYMISYFKSK